MLKRTVQPENWDDHIHANNAESPW